MYQAIVKKKEEGEKKRQWIKYHHQEWKVISKKKALSYPSQILFYKLKTKEGDTEESDE